MPHVQVNLLDDRCRDGLPGATASTASSQPGPLSSCHGDAALSAFKLDKGSETATKGLNIAKERLQRLYVTDMFGCLAKRSCLRLCTATTPLAAARKLGLAASLSLRFHPPHHVLGLQGQLAAQHPGANQHPRGSAGSASPSFRPSRELHVLLPGRMRLAPAVQLFAVPIGELPLGQEGSTP